MKTELSNKLLFYGKEYVIELIADDENPIDAIKRLAAEKELNKKNIYEEDIFNIDF